jgi:hypothetical protein
LKSAAFVEVLASFLPSRRCGDCEYFDRGTADKVTGFSDCHNPRAPRFQTYADWTCDFFYPDTTAVRE